MLLKKTHQDPLVLTGSSPNALLKLISLVEVEAIPPKMIVGMPVGFVGVLESKDCLL